MTKLILLMTMFALRTASAEGYVDEFLRKTGLQPGGNYVTDPDNANCLNGELTVEADGTNGVLIKIGPDILVENVSEKPVPPLVERPCTTTFVTKTVATGRIDTLKEKRCPKVKGLQFVAWHTVITVTPRGFDYVVSYENNTSRKCEMIRK